jgi:hypothetical protein
MILKNIIRRPIDSALQRQFNFSRATIVKFFLTGSLPNLPESPTWKGGDEWQLGAKRRLKGF